MKQCMLMMYYSNEKTYVFKKKQDPLLVPCSSYRPDGLGFFFNDWSLTKDKEEKNREINL